MQAPSGTKRTRALAPGKLILTGEHAVVHGKPALVTAINRYAETTLRPEPTGLFSLRLPDMNRRHVCAWEGLARVREQLHDRYAAFSRGETTINEVLRNPEELLHFAAALLLERHPDVVLPGVDIQVRSQMPIGCGMGSSAATVASLLRGLAAYLGIEPEDEEVFDLALEAEKLQHGHPSGVDPYTAVNGGLLRFQDRRAKHLTATPPPLRLVHTGAPESTTGECVEYVHRTFGDDPIWDDFEQLEFLMEAALGEAKRDTIGAIVRENHRLLVRIGVVPEKVRSFVEKVEEGGCAAKICGAGSIAGEGAGMAWILSETSPADICEEFGYTLMDVEESRMAHESYRASAPGSLMLLGEHAVLHGRHAMVCAVSARIRVELRPRPDRRIDIVSPLGHHRTDIDTLAPDDGARFVLGAIKVLRQDLAGGLALEIQSDFPSNVGLGSSAAVTVATLAALHASIGQGPPPEELLHEAVRVIRDVQGLGSGSDAAASVFGGTLVYRSEPLAVRKLENDPPITVVYSGHKEPTVKVVQKVEESRRAKPARMEAIFDRMNESVSAAEQAVNDADWKRAGAIFDQNQELMDAIGVNTPTLAAIVAVLKEQEEIYGAKISGAGMGDCVVGLGRATHDAFDFEMIPVSISSEGVLIE